MGKSFKRSARLCKKTQMRDERGGSEVYDVREEKSAMCACLHYPRRGVNNYMHKREIDARLGEIGWKKGKNLLQTRIQTTETVEEKERMEIGTCRVFESVPAASRDSDSYKQPLLASSTVMIGLMRHLRWRLRSSAHTANPRHGTLGPDGRTPECI